MKKLMMGMCVFGLGASLLLHYMSVPKHEKVQHHKKKMRHGLVK